VSERHVINLATAWEPPAAGSRAWVRRFGQPSGIEPGDRLWLVIEDGATATLVLNGVCLPAEIGRHDVTELLESRNELLLIPAAVLAIDAEAPVENPSPAPLHGRRDLDARHGRVSLEIETSVA
jgi:hypothetical protein